MAPQVLAAIITGGLSLVLALYNLWAARQQDKRVFALEKLRSQLAGEEAARKARIDYEYDALRRLHDACGPAMFTLFDLAEEALQVIKGLTDPSVWVELAKPEPTPPTTERPTLPAAKYEALSGIYGLYAPLAVIRGMGRKLSQLDLTLDPLTELQYFLAARLYNTFKDDATLAAIEPALPYTPFAPGWRTKRELEPATYWWQGLTMGRLEGMLDLLTVPSGDSHQGRVVSFGEFERLYNDMFADPDEARRKSVAAAANALHRFRPADRPVFWRVIITQARLYQALLHTRSSRFDVPASRQEWWALLRLEDPHTFAWRSGSPQGAPLDQTIAVTDTYLRLRVVETWLRQHPGTPAQNTTGRNTTGRSDTA